MKVSKNVTKIYFLFYFTDKHQGGFLDLAPVIGINNQSTEMLMNNILKCIRCRKMLEQGRDESYRLHAKEIEKKI